MTVGMHVVVAFTSQTHKHEDHEAQWTARLNKYLTSIGWSPIRDFQKPAQILHFHKPGLDLVNPKPLVTTVITQPHHHWPGSRRPSHLNWPVRRLSATSARWALGQHNHRVTSLSPPTLSFVSTRIDCLGLTGLVLAQSRTCMCQPWAGQKAMLPLAGLTPHFFSAGKPTKVSKAQQSTTVDRRTSDSSNPFSRQCQTL